MKTLRFAIACLFFVHVVCVTASAQNTGDKIKLQLRLEEGKTYKIKTVTEQKMTQEIQGMNNDVSSTIGFGLLHDVEKVDPDGTMSIKITHDSVLYKMDSAMMQIDYDSENSNEIDNPRVNFFAALTGETYACKIASDGKVHEVSGIEEMIESIIKKMGNPEDPGNKAAKKVMEDQFDSTEDTMTSMFAFYPDNPVGIGDTWSKSIKTQAGYHMVTDTEYTLIDRKDGLAIIETRSTMNSDPDAKPIDMMQMTMKYDISGESKGIWEIDEATGWIKRSKTTMQNSGTITMSGTPQLPEGLSMPFASEGITTVESEE